MLYLSNIFILITTIYLFFGFHQIKSINQILNLQGIHFIYFGILCLFVYSYIHITIWYIIDEIRGIDKIKLSKKDIKTIKKLVKEIYKEINDEKIDYKLKKQIIKNQDNHEKQNNLSEKI